MEAKAASRCNAAPSALHRNGRASSACLDISSALLLLRKLFSPLFQSRSSFFSLICTHLAFPPLSVPLRSLLPPCVDSPVLHDALTEKRKLCCLRLNVRQASASAVAKRAPYWACAFLLCGGCPMTVRRRRRGAAQRGGAQIVAVDAFPAYVIGPDSVPPSLVPRFAVSPYTCCVCLFFFLRWSASVSRTHLPFRLFSGERAHFPCHTSPTHSSSFSPLQRWRFLTGVFPLGCSCVQCC